MKESAAIQCPLCGHKFDRSEAAAGCQSCPFQKKSCGNVKCPSCGYDFPAVPERTGKSFLSRLLDKI